MWSSLFEQQQHRPTAILDEAAVQQLQGTISGFILDCVEYMDTQWGAAEWTTRQVAVGTVIVLGMIRAMCHEAYGVNWYSLVHAAVTGYGSAMAVWLSVFAAVPLTGTAEPLRSIVGCGGPLTSLHRIVPAITMGYGIFDILDGVGHGLDFVSMHWYGIVYSTDSTVPGTVRCGFIAYRIHADLLTTTLLLATFYVLHTCVVITRSGNLRRHGVFL